MRTYRCTVAIIMALNVSTEVIAQTSQSEPPTKYFNQKVSDSNPLRTEQARELDEYVKTIAADRTRFNALFKPDYSSKQAFEKSAAPLRKAFCDSIGYPPPGVRPTKPSSFKQIGEDSIGIYYRAMIPILPGVHSEGIYIVPNWTAPGSDFGLV